METSGRNLTPDKLPTVEREILFEACDEHLRAVVKTLRPEWIIGIGMFAEKRAKYVLSEDSLKISGVLHPSPASPAANRNWAETVENRLRQLEIWR